MKTLLLIIFCLSGTCITAQDFVRKLDPGERFDTVRQAFAIGDVNNDKLTDTAIAVYERIIAADSTIINLCSKGVCYIDIDMPKGIDNLQIEAFNIFIDTAPDVNGDGANEILIYWWWTECCWVTLDMYTYKAGKWKTIATSKAFISWDDEDFKNRVIKKGSNYFLMGDKWNKDNAVILKDKVKINIQ